MKVKFGSLWLFIISWRKIGCELVGGWGEQIWVDGLRRQWKEYDKESAEDRNGKETQYCTLLIRNWLTMLNSVYKFRPTPSIQRLTVYEMGCNVMA